MTDDSSAYKDPTPDATQTERGVLVFRFELEIDEFLPRRREFLTTLARLVEVPLHEIHIEEIRTGCVIILLTLPTGARTLVLAGVQALPDHPELARFLSSFAFRSLRETRALDASFLNLLPSPKSEPADQIGWLHLSDLHVRTGKKGEAFSADLVTDSLVRDLPNLLSRAGVAPDIVFFTGDVAFSGKPSEYQKAESILDRVRSALPKPASFFVVPGNHDVDRELIDSAADAELEKQLDSKLKVRSHLLDDESVAVRMAGFQRLGTFMRFVEDTNGFGQPAYNNGFYFTHLEPLPQSGLTLGIAGLNSAWRCGSDEDLGHLLIGDPQLVEAVKAVKDADLRIALLHHPPDSAWYKEFDREIHPTYFGSFDFVLFGHEHRAWHKHYRGATHGYHELSAGALYEHGRTLATCNAVRLDRAAGMISMYYWRYYELRDEWDIDPSKERGGMAEIAIEDALMERLSLRSLRRSL
jgi:predicted MPP superfamily phosphohydrolase